MDPIVIYFSDFQPNFNTIARGLKIKAGSSTAKDLLNLVTEARNVAKPKAIFTITSIDKMDNQIVHLNGIGFRSQVLSTNLEGVHRSFPYIATCGIELDSWKNSFNDIITRYFADFITGLALEKAVEGLFKQIKQEYGLKKTATMNPGSLEDWPLQAQTSLFSLLGSPEKTIGVSLTDSLLMIPRQSVSGILFETETDFVNCQLCPRQGCPNRRAPYNKSVAKKYLR